MTNKEAIIQLIDSGFCVSLFGVNICKTGFGYCLDAADGRSNYFYDESSPAVDHFLNTRDPKTPPWFTLPSELIPEPFRP